jgi:hypothetical protein
MCWMSEKQWFDSWQRQEIYLLPKSSKLGLGPTQPAIQWVPETLPGVMRLGHEDDCSLPSSAEVKNEWVCTSTPLIYLYGMHRDNLTLCLHCYKKPLFEEYCK